MNIYKSYAIQTGKHSPLPAADDPIENYVLAKLDRNRMILYQNNLDTVVESAADRVAKAALDLIASVSV